jgi:hypothetical protein
MTTADPIALLRTQLRDAAARRIGGQRRRQKIVIAAALLFAATAIAGIAVAADGWLTGQAAPPSVVADFGSYRPQLGFRPDPGSAVLVAEDGGSSLYATTNAEGSYCVVASAPWKRPATLPDGGSCVGKPTAAQPFVAGVVGGSPSDPAGNVTLLVAGRINLPGAAQVSFDSPTGEPISRPLGPNGFFLAAVPATLCQNGTWTPTFVAHDASGRTLGSSAITIEQPIELSGNQIACWLVPITSAQAPSVELQPSGQP